MDKIKFESNKNSLKEEHQNEIVIQKYDFFKSQKIAINIRKNTLIHTVEQGK